MRCEVRSSLKARHGLASISFLRFPPLSEQKIKLSFPRLPLLGHNHNYKDDVTLYINPNTKFTHIHGRKTVRGSFWLCLNVQIFKVNSFVQCLAHVNVAIGLGMMELRSRSRSKTPFQTESFIKAESFAGSNHVSVTRATRRTTRTTTSGEAYYQGSTTKPVKSKSTKATRSLIKTSDYSSEEGEFEEHTHISENERNQIIEDAKAAANGSAQVSALNLYRKAERYWDKYPKTDYTYSRHSRDRVEIAPGVVQMPNMSRRCIHSDSSTNTESYHSLGSHHIKQRLFASPNNNYDDEVDHDFKIIRSSSTRTQTVISTITSFFMSIYTMIFWCFYKVFGTTTSMMFQVGKNLHLFTSRVMLLDTWLLRKGDAGKRTKAVVALCLLPLLLFAAWYLLSSLGGAIYWSLFSPSAVSLGLATPSEESSPQVTEDIRADVTGQTSTTQISTDELIDKILQNPKFYNVINDYRSDDVKAGRQSDEKLRQEIDELRAEIERVRSKRDALELSKNADLDRILFQVRGENVRSVARLTQKINRCCGRHAIDLEPYVTKLFAGLINDPEFLAKQQGLTEWLHALFAAKKDLEERLYNVTQNLSQKFEISIEDTANQVMEKVVARLSQHREDGGSITDVQIEKIVKSALKVYDADRTGLVDYAMEPLGGEILTTRCTEAYPTTAVITVLGIPVWHPKMSPRVVISPGLIPGECFAFQNFPGFLVIKLSGNVKIEAFSMEHVSRLLVPNGKIDSAPKEFEVYGLNSENDMDPVKIGEFVYEYDGDPIQFFTAQEVGTFPMVEIRIKSNHGNPNYTCLYRFRVHGKLSNKVT